MTENELQIELKSSTVGGMYFFYGDEDYMKNHRAAEIKKCAVPDATLAAFNLFEFSFGDGALDVGAVADALLAPPMMAEKKAIDIRIPDLDALKEKERGALLALLRDNAEACADDTVVILRVSAGGFDAGTAKKPSAFLRDASKFMKTVEFPHQPPAKLHRWLERHASEYGLALSPRVSELIIGTAGRSMYRLLGEIKKVSAYAAAHGDREITEAHVVACVTKTDEDDAFALANCVLEGNTAGALLSLAVKKRKKEEPIYLLSQITKVFSDLSAAACFILDGTQI